MSYIQLQDLSDESIEKLAERTAEKLHELQIKERKQLESKYFHNTKILLRNYQKLKAFTDNTYNDMTEIENTFWAHGKLSLSFLMENRAKTWRIMKHVDDALNHFENECKKDKKNGFRVLQLKYITVCWSDEKIADYFNVDRTTIVKWTKIALEDLSIHLYGVDALDL